MPQGIYEHKRGVYHHSEETKRKIGLANSQKIRTEAQKEYLRKLRLGKKHSEETKKKMRVSNTHYWLGKKRPNLFSEETKQKTRERLLAHPISPKWVQEKIAKINKGKFGKDHPCWKEFKKRPLYKSIRETYKYKFWRNGTFIRDNYICVICRKHGGTLQVDHYPKRFIDIIREYKIDTIEKALSCEELWNIQNGRTLCINCHRKTDTWGRRKN